MVNEADEARPHNPDEGKPKDPASTKPASSAAPVDPAADSAVSAETKPAIEVASLTSTPSPSDTEGNPSSPTAGEAGETPTSGTAPPEQHAGEGSAEVVADPAYSEYHHDEYHDEYHDPHHHDSHHHDDGSAGGGGDSTVDPLFAPDPEEGGGPVKTFLEHLEDFRWLLIKCTAAVLITMVVCLLGVNYVWAVLTWPLKQASKYTWDARQMLVVKVGTNELAKLRLDTNEVANLPLAGQLLGTNRYTELAVTPTLIGTNIVLGVQIRTNSSTIPELQFINLAYLDPAGPFINSLHIAFFAGLLLAAPIVFYHIAQFLIPALKPVEKKYFLRAMTPAVLLFITGVCLCYFLLLPLALYATKQYSLWMGVDVPFWRAETYFSFCMWFMLGMGLGFELPVILLALVKIGLLNHEKLAGFRRFMVIINLFAGALLTTPEIITQVAMFVPLQLLYELTIWIAWYWEQSDRAYARKRLLQVVLGIVLAGALLWLGYTYGWPWLRENVR
jgi:sec-independent protein translocase protein TatC